MERGVESEDRMPLRENEAVPVGMIVGGEVQHAAVQGRQDVRHGEPGADVPDVGALRLLENDPPKRGY